MGLAYLPEKTWVVLGILMYHTLSVWVYNFLLEGFRFRSECEVNHRLRQLFFVVKLHVFSCYLIAHLM